MFPWGLVVSWGGLNQLRGGAMCSVCSSSHSRSPAVPPSWITFFFLLLHNQLASSGALCHWTFKCSTVWAESGTYQLFCTAAESTRSLFCFGWIFIFYILYIIYMFFDWTVFFVCFFISTSIADNYMHLQPISELPRNEENPSFSCFGWIGPLWCHKNPCHQGVCFTLWGCCLCLL